MPVERRLIVVRVRGFPTTDSKAADNILRKIISINLKEEERAESKFRVSIVPSCIQSSNLESIVDFENTLPAFLSNLKNNSLESIQFEIDNIDEYLSFDRHFHGFTQLYGVNPSSTVADIIAIAGIDGHSYGSWQGRGNARRMWLRHFLSKDLPNCRTMIFGYNSKLSVRGIAKTEDYVRELLEGLRGVRGMVETRQRPLIFVAHSFGGIMVARCINKAIQSRKDADPVVSSLHRATCGFLFFGVPHRGLDVEDMLRIMGEDKHPRSGLIEQIGKESETLKQQLEDFKDNLGDRKVISFYETEQTRRLKKDEKGHWVRSGPHYTGLDIDSALLQLSSQNEIKVPLHANHSNIVKFDSRDSQGYSSAIGHLKEFESIGPSAVQARFCM